MRDRIINTKKLRRIVTVSSTVGVLVAMTCLSQNIKAQEQNTVDQSTIAAQETTQPQTTIKQVETTSANIKVVTPGIKAGNDGVKASVKWNGINKQDKYEIWTSDKKNGKYKKTDVIAGNSYSIKKQDGKLLYVKIKAIREVNGKVYQGNFSTPVQVISGVKIKKAVSSLVKTASVTWKAGVSNTGYQIQYSTGKNFKKTSTIKIKGKSTNNVTLYDLKQGKKYYVRLRTYKKSGKKNIYSPWSQIKEVKVTSTEKVLNGDYKNTEGYFRKSVFFGDSVLQGFQIYTKSKGKGYLDGTKVMGVISYSLIAALQPESPYHPLYKGKHTAPEYVTKSLGAEKVFLFFGINDIHNTKNPELTYQNYKKLISRIKKVNPGVKVHIISTTYPMKGSKDCKNYSKRIHELNKKMRKYCDKTDCEYIDIASYLETSDGYLKSDLCSDKFVHQTMDAYTIWDKVLRNFAAGKSIK